MKSCLFGPIIFLLLIALCAVDSRAENSGTMHTTARAKTNVADPDLPLDVFRQIDQRFSMLDADNQVLALESKRLSEDAGHSKSMLRNLQHSREFRERTRTVNQLLAITARAEQSYKARRQPYGARLFRDLHNRFASIDAPIIGSTSARTIAAFNRDQKLIEDRTLPAVVQFQAISGGYTGLACHAGSHACCQSRLVRQGQLKVRGCTWSCTSKLSVSADEFLGPLIPKSVTAVKNAVPERPNRSLKPTPARNLHRQKSVERATAPANRQTTPAGNE